MSCNPDHDHVYSEQWSKDAEYHWHACESVGCTEVSDKAEHAWADGACSACGAKEDEPLDSENSIITLSCIMTQDFFAYGKAQTFVLDITFIFSDYGTTVVN